MGCGDGEVIHVDAEDDLPAVWVELVEKTGIEGRTNVSIVDEVGAEGVVECLWGPVQSVEGLLEGPHVFFAVLVVSTEAFWELEVDSLADLGIEEGAEDVEAVENHALLGCEG